MRVEGKLSPEVITGEARVTRPVRGHRRAVVRLLRRLSGGDASVRIGHGRDEVELPGEVRDLLTDALEGLARGCDVAVVEVAERGESGESAKQQEMTTQQAAQLLNVSRPHLVKLCRTGRLPYHKVGNRHRLYRGDVETYKIQREHNREDTLTRIAEFGPDEF